MPPKKRRAKAGPRSAHLFDSASARNCQRIAAQNRRARSELQQLARQQEQEQPSEAEMLLPRLRSQAKTAETCHDDSEDAISTPDSLNDHLSTDILPDQSKSRFRFTAKKVQSDKCKQRRQSPQETPPLPPQQQQQQQQAMQQSYEHSPQALHQSQFYPISFPQQSTPAIPLVHLSQFPPPQHLSQQQYELVQLQPHQQLVPMQPLQSSTSQQLSSIQQQPTQQYPPPQCAYVQMQVQPYMQYYPSVQGMQPSATPHLGFFSGQPLIQQLPVQQQVQQQQQQQVQQQPQYVFQSTFHPQQQQQQQQCMNPQSMQSLQTFHYIPQAMISPQTIISPQLSTDDFDKRAKIRPLSSASALSATSTQSSQQTALQSALSPLPIPTAISPTSLVVHQNQFNQAQHIVKRQRVNDVASPTPPTVQISAVPIVPQFYSGPTTSTAPPFLRQPQQAHPQSASTPTSIPASIPLRAPRPLSTQLNPSNQPNGSITTPHPH